MGFFMVHYIPFCSMRSPEIAWFVLPFPDTYYIWLPPSSSYRYKFGKTSRAVFKTLAVPLYCLVENGIPCSWIVKFP